MFCFLHYTTLRTAAIFCPEWIVFVLTIFCYQTTVRVCKFSNIGLIQFIIIYAASVLRVSRSVTVISGVIMIIIK